MFGRFVWESSVWGATHQSGPQKKKKNYRRVSRKHKTSRGVCRLQAVTGRLEARTKKKKNGV